jgi:hypothetical protein
VKVLVAAQNRSNRSQPLHGVVVQNNGSTPVFLGGSTVTATGATAGVQIAANGTPTVPTTGAEPLSLYGVCASGTNNVAYLFPG